MPPIRRSSRLGDDVVSHSEEVERTGTLPIVTVQDGWLVVTARPYSS
jgi:hypothetical protein